MAKRGWGAKSFSRRDAVKVNALAESVRRTIIDGRLRPGDRLPTRTALVQQHGVSGSTVQKALDELSRDGFVVAQGTRGTFVAEHLPHLARCGLVIPPLSDRADHDLHKPFLAALHTEALRQRQRGDLELEIYEDVLGNIDDPHFQQLADDIRRCQLAGLIVMYPWMFDHTPLAQLWQKDMAIVSISAKPLPNLLRVHLDDEQMIEDALDHFAAHGRHRIAVFDHDPKRQEFIRAAMATRKLETRPGWMPIVPAVSRATARDMMILLLQARELPEGLLIADDSLVEPATAGLRDSRARGSNPIEVIAHANFPHPTLSHVPCRRIGFDVREVLANCMELIQRCRRGEPVTAVTEVAPLWEDQLPTQPVNADVTV